MAKKRKTVYSGIGGQAVLEGVMMRNKDTYAVAVRKPDGGIDVSTKVVKYNPKSLLRRIPFIRGIFNFVDSLVLGMDILSYSAEQSEEEEAQENGLMEKLFHEKADDVTMGITVFISIIVAVLLFMVLPYAASELLGRYIRNHSLVLLIEGGLRILVFLVYVAGIALMKDIRRLYQYHGAEHKCINCIECGRPLTVRNVKRASRFHKRCGTSFLILIVLIGVILCFFIRTEEVWLRMLIRILLVPVIAGISYELLRLAGTKESVLLDIISAPGLWLQRITTKEPDEDMIEVAIASVEAVFDWEKFQKKHFKTRTVKKKRVEPDGREVETGEETLEISVLDIDEMLKMTGRGDEDQ
ncbi:MAG: DUF1385 domain-containing protein [Lachnospiraceae bacterium]|nr:DUF1385 domain-containing protein [Lachnospiraceae bacterium]